MKYRGLKLAFAVVLVAAASAAPALAQDSPAGPGGGDAPAPGPAAPAGPADPAKAPDAPKAEAPKKERKVDPKALEMIDAYYKLVASAENAGAKEMKFTGAAELPNSPEPLGLDAKWSAKEGFDFEVVLSESIKAMIPSEMAEVVE